MKSTFGLIAVLFMFASYSNAGIAAGDTFVLWAGYSDMTGMSGGTTEATEVLESISIRNDTESFVFSIIGTQTHGFFEMGGTMKPLIYSASSKLVILDKTPSNIISYSNRFSNEKWIIGEQSDFLFYPDMKGAAPYWSIPINSSGQPFLKDDFYTIRVSDTTGIKWMRDTSDDRSFFGKFIRFQNKADTTGNYVPDSANYFVCGKSPSWRATGGMYTGSNPFNVLRLGTSSMIYPLRTSVLSMGAGCYDNQITYYKPIQSVGIIVQANTGTFKDVSNHSTYFNLLGQRINPSQNSYFPMVLINKMNGSSRAKTKYELKMNQEQAKK